MEAVSHNKEQQFISQLSSYQWKFIILRLGIVSAFALSFMLLADTLVAGRDLSIPFLLYIKVAVLFIIISESNVLLDNIAERFFPIPSKIKTRILLHFLLSMSIGALALLYFKQQLHTINLLHQPITWLMVAFGFIFVFIFIILSISVRITSKWMLAQKEVKDLKQLQLRNDYNALQDQLNPHFLFNNLSVLKSMIKYDQQAAIDFTQNFTDTYRYVLQSANKKTVLLSTEIEFIGSYIDLHQERLGEGLIIEKEIDNAMLDKKIPPLSLQLLIENAIKHNIASKAEPLIITIGTGNETIWVENNLQLKETSYSTSKGLKNLVSRYAFLTVREVIILHGDKTFKVELPLL